MPIRVTVNGKIHEFPDGTPPEAIQGALAKLYAPGMAPQGSNLTMGMMGNSAPEQPSSKSEEGVLANTVRTLRGENPGISALGGLIGSLGPTLAEGAAPKIVGGFKRIPGAITATGQAVERAGEIAQPYGLMGATADMVIGKHAPGLGDAAGIAIPPTMRILGRGMQKAGEWMGGKEPVPGESIPGFPKFSNGAASAESGFQEPVPGESAPGFPKFSDHSTGSGGYKEPVPDPNAVGQAHMQQVIQQAMEEMLKDSRPQSVQLPEGTSTTIEGFAKQSGKFGKNGRLGQTGGASVKPAMSPATADTLPTTRTDFMGKDVEWPDVSGGSDMGKAAQDIAGGQTERRINPSGELPAGVSERRYDELLQKLGGRGGDAAEGVSLTPETAPPPAAGTAKEALQSAEDRLSGLAKPKLSQQQWKDLVTRQGLTQTARSAGLSKEEVANLAGIDINTPRSRPLEAQDRIDAFNERQAREGDR